MHLSLWIIVGVCGAFALLLLAVFVWWWRKRRRRVAFASMDVNGNRVGYGSLSPGGRAGGSYAVPKQGRRGSRNEAGFLGSPDAHSVMSHMTDYTEDGSIRYDSDTEDEHYQQKMPRTQDVVLGATTHASSGANAQTRAGRGPSGRVAASGDSQLHPALYVEIQDGGRGPPKRTSKDRGAGHPAVVVNDGRGRASRITGKAGPGAKRRSSIRSAGDMNMTPELSHTDHTDAGSERYSSDDEDDDNGSATGADSDAGVSAYYTPSPQDHEDELVILQSEQRRMSQ